MNRFQRFKVLTFLVSVLIMFSLIQSTFAKYKTEAVGTTNMSIARWKIVVNEQDIMSNQYITNTLTPFFSGNSHVADGVIAPNAVGYFDLLIDCSEVDVSFDYTISSEINETSSVDDLKIIGYTVDGGPIIDVDGSLEDITETILFDDTDKTRNIRVFVTWDDSENRTMDNAADTLAALSQENAKLDININFTQLTD